MDTTVAASSELHQCFCDRVRAVRKARGWSQVVLAEKLGVKPSVVANMELGRNVPTLRLIERVAAVLDCDPLKLLQRQKSSV